MTQLKNVIPIAHAGKVRQRRRQIEGSMQMTLISHLGLVWYGERRVSDLIFHIPNGGKRNALEAARFKRMGVRPGVSDLFLPVPIRTYHGMFVELKADKNKETDTQKEFAKMVYGFGYYVGTYWAWEEAAADIVGYLKAGELTVRAPKLWGRP
jgi:hypothetical protein